MADDAKAAEQVMRLMIAETFGHVRTHLLQVEETLDGLQSLFRGFETLFAEMQAGVKVRGVELSKRRALAANAVQGVAELRTQVALHRDAIETSINKYQATAASDTPNAGLDS